MLILDLKVQRQIAALIERAAAAPMARWVVEHHLAQRRRDKSVSPDPARVLMIAENYVVVFVVEDAPGLGLARHLTVSWPKSEDLAAPIAVAMLAREFGFSAPPAERTQWLEPVPGRGRGIHLLERVSALDSLGLTLARVMLEEDGALEPAPDDIGEDEMT